jgi:acyl carrier protein
LALRESGLLTWPGLRTPNGSRPAGQGFKMTTLERLSRILEQHYSLDPARLTPDQPLDSLGIDSLGMIEMLFFIEEEFRVRLPSDNVTFATLGDAAKYVDELIANQKPAGRPQPAPTGRAV